MNIYFFLFAWKLKIRSLEIIKKLRMSEIPIGGFTRILDVRHSSILNSGGD